MKKRLMKNQKGTSQKGFVALFAVLVSSILLLMALSISGVAYKEQLFSINAKSSQYSFTAADTGMECALYWDVKKDWYNPSTLPPNPPENIICGGVNPELLGNISTVSKFVYELDVYADVNGRTIASCAVFSIDKNYDEDNDSVGESTKIDSRGYNVECDNIDFGLSGTGDLQFANGVGARAVERYLGAVYLNNN
jgi:hypothetical protein